MAEMFINSACNFLMISGEPDNPAPYVGVSAQIDVMQDFMESDMLNVMTGAEDIEVNAPELWEAQEMSQDEDIADMLTQIEALESSESAEARGFGDEDIYNSEQIQELIAQIKARPHAEGKTPTDGSRPLVVDDLLLWGPLALFAVDMISSPTVRKAAGAAWRFVKKAPGRIKNWKSAASRLKTAAKGLPTTLKNAEARNALWRSLASGAADASSTAMLLTQQLGSSAAQLTANLQMTAQITNMADAMRMFTPNIASLYDGFIQLDDAVSLHTRLENNGSNTDVTIPPPSAPAEGYVSAEQVLADAANGKLPPGVTRTIRATTTTPTETTPTPPAATPTKRSVGVPNINKFTVLDALRYLCRELSIFEKEIKLFNSNMVMDKDNIPKFLTSKESTIFTKDVGLGEIMFRALNTQGKETSSAGVAGPTEILSIAEQFKQAFPVIDVIDPITKKKSTISVFELIMQAQSAKVIELGPGFLKWYPDLEVLENNVAVTTTPKIGD